MVLPFTRSSLSRPTLPSTSELDKDKEDKDTDKDKDKEKDKDKDADKDKDKDKGTHTDIHKDKEIMQWLIAQDVKQHDRRHNACP